jgi:hypothetical protein
MTAIAQCGKSESDALPWMLLLAVAPGSLEEEEDPDTVKVDAPENEPAFEGPMTTMVCVL